MSQLQFVCIQCMFKTAERYRGCSSKHLQFSISPKRVESLKEFQTFTNTPIHKILHPVQIRWLSLENAVNRIVEQYNALISFFTDAVTNEGVLDTQHILTALQDPLTNPFLIFLQFGLPLFTNIYKDMQSEQPKLHELLSSISGTYKTLLEYFVKRGEAVFARNELQRACEFSPIGGNIIGCQNFINERVLKSGCSFHSKKEMPRFIDRKCKSNE